MMEFPFDLNDYLNEDITTIGTDLLPVGFQGSSDLTRRCVAAVSDIIDKMGQASARAQKLITPVTNAIRYSNSNHIIYLLVNHTENDGRGTAVGLLKMGWKDLFVVDLQGIYTKQNSFCCLDFYIDETKQRQGFGKQLYDFMLIENNTEPGMIPIDRPSEKFVKFLQKHYGLQTIIPQPNNFILYEQFFSDTAHYDDSIKHNHYNRHMDSYFEPNYKAKTGLKEVVPDKWCKKRESIYR